MSASGGETQLLPGQDIALSYVNPVFSPDGDWVALEQRRRGNSDIVLLSPETGQHIQITTSPVGDIDPTWSPDGSRLAFCYHTGGHNWEVFVYNFADGSLVNNNVQSFL